MRTSRLLKYGIVIPAMALAACQPQLHSDLPRGPAAYAQIEPAELKAQAGGPYLLGIGDIVSVDVFQEPDLSLKQVPIDRSGNLYLPLVGEIHAAGRSQTDLSQAIEHAYGEHYLRNPRVAVVINQAQASTVTVEGEVTQPGVYEFQPGATLISALAQARSPTRQAKLDEVLIFRTVNGQRMGGRFNVTDIRAGRVPDPQILPGDVVVVGFSKVQGAYRDLLQAAPLLNVFTQF